MNTNTACFLLNISMDELYDPSTGEMDRRVVRRQYRAQSLRLHPDKNPEPDAAEQFQRMRDAYLWLEAPRTDAKADTDHIAETLWSWFQDACESRLVQWIERQDKDTLYRMHAMLSHPTIAAPWKNHPSICHIQSLLATTWKTKCDQDQRIILRPTLTELLNDQVYRLVVEDNTYWVPLWVDELVYDLGSRELVVQCIPDLPSNVIIDDTYQHVYVSCVFSISQDVWGKKELEVVISPGNLSESTLLTKRPDSALIDELRYPIQVSQLRIDHLPQKILVTRRGIPRANTNKDNLYDVSRRGSIFAWITLIP
jgi:hypothetical protein